MDKTTGTALRMLRLLALVSVLAGLLGAATVSGRVYLRDGQSRRPLPGARVLARALPGQEVIQTVETDAEGDYRLSNLPPLAILLAVRKANYAVVDTTGGDRGVQLNLATADSLSDVEFELVLGGVLSGQVTDTLGEPLEGAQIELRRTAGSGSAPPPVHLETDESGAWRAFGVAPGRYLVAARRRNRGSGTLYYPGRDSQDKAEAIAISPGEEIRGIDLRFDTDSLDRGANSTLVDSNPAVDATAPNAKALGGLITGRVVSAQTGEPLRGATVAISSLRDKEFFTKQTSTGLGGEFSFQQLQPGSYGVFSEKADFESRNLAQQVTIAHEKSRENLEIKLNRSPAISGRVKGQDGLPVIGAAVEAHQLRFVNGRRIAVKVGSTTSDDRGVYRLAKLSPGRYVVSASTAPPAEETPQGELDLGTARAFYPGAGRPTEAVPLDLRYGQDLTGIDPVLVAKETFSVAGVVADVQAGGPCLACVIRAVSLDETYGLLQPEAKVASNGTYLVRGLTPGGYRLVVEKSSAGRVVTSYQTVQVTNRNLTGVPLAVGAVRTVTGRVTFESQPPSPPEPGQKTTLEVEFATPEAVGPVERFKVASDGTFLAADLSCQNCLIRITGLPDGGFVNAVRLGGIDLPAPEIEIPQDSPLDSVEVMVSFRSASLAGQVKPAESKRKSDQAVEAALLLYPRDNQPRYVTSLRAPAKPDGGFSLTGIAPGSYTAFAVQRMSNLDWDAPEVRTKMQAYGRSVTLEAGKLQTLELPLAPEELQ